VTKTRKCKQSSWRCSVSVSNVTVELHLFGLINTANHSDIQKIRKIGFFFENSLHWQLEGEIISTNGCFRLHIYLRTNKTVIHNSLHVFDKWGKFKP